MCQRGRFGDYSGMPEILMPGLDEGEGAWGVSETDERGLRASLVEGKRLRGAGRSLIGLEAAGTAVWDGMILWLSSPVLVFKAYAPELFTVIAGE